MYQHLVYEEWKNVHTDKTIIITRKEKMKGDYIKIFNLIHFILEKPLMETINKKINIKIKTIDHCFK